MRLILKGRTRNTEIHTVIWIIKLYRWIILNSKYCFGRTLNAEDGGSMSPRDFDIPYKTTQYQSPEDYNLKEQIFETRQNYVNSSRTEKCLN
jgi:hypothetical protein